jgi:hypothetical protein
MQAKKQAQPAEGFKTQVAVNNEGKTNEATKKVDEPLKKGQTRPTEKQAEKKEQKKEEQRQPSMLPEACCLCKTLPAAERRKSASDLRVFSFRV